ncbi:hypothetical protein [Pseudoroseicyclus tamaricis]|uniref:Uncharacterized protein n=1 Tax=Pseudoroseicyclus tamaricis TaxID=2705421 RepID=A0A6B2K1N3_9RHOB|nr:hypothetical protein [Pseudoroseicyclus tamaricis]NDV00286.1 hypothetical protein [Pseudoroseicyclus tamaricis]
MTRLMTEAELEAKLRDMGLAPEPEDKARILDGARSARSLAETLRAFLEQESR